MSLAGTFPMWSNPKSDPSWWRFTISFEAARAASCASTLLNMSQQSLGERHVIVWLIAVIIARLVTGEAPGCLEAWPAM